MKKDKNWTKAWIETPYGEWERQKDSCQAGLVGGESEKLEEAVALFLRVEWLTF